ncbi:MULTISPECIES: hypothetical protein [Gordonia]|uniref:Addiction module antidote protein, HigA family n=1 Tax=Gordonia cholesterolivorans TaxID=559625 RepID=A0ABN3HM90_9ACTN
MADFAPIHPGKTLAKDYLPECGLPSGLAEAIHVSAGRINDIILGRRGNHPAGDR